VSEATVLDSISAKGYTMGADMLRASGLLGAQTRSLDSGPQGQRIHLRAADVEAGGEDARTPSWAPLPQRKSWSFISSPPRAWSQSSWTLPLRCSEP